MFVENSGMKDFVIKYKWKLVGLIAGAMAGFAYWYFIGCNSGSCPIQSKWEISMLYGALIGFVLSGSGKKEQKADKKATEQESNP